MKIFLAAATMALSMADNSPAAEPEIKFARAGARAVDEAPADNFTGPVKVEMLFSPDGPDRASAGSVTFPPGARTAWHTHPLGQTLIVTAGVGRIQRWGGSIEEMRPGDVVRIPPHVKHWHGAAPDGAMTHTAITELMDGQAATWMEKVSDEQYGASPVYPMEAPSAEPSAARKLMGDVAPKLADLTDRVLFGDVWKRPGLSPRDRSLVTVSALIAMNRPEQLRSHVALALTHGVTRPELVEAVTHLAFYAGWPSAVTATGVVREVFDAKP